VGGDCDDGDPGRNPAAAEVCDGFDNDCNFAVDDGGDVVLLHRDLDRDGWGSDRVVREGCGDLPGWTEQGGDCDDLLPWVHPGAPEPPYGGDNDCDGHTSLSATEDFLVWPRPDANCEEGTRIDVLYRDAGGRYYDPFPITSTCELAERPLVYLQSFDGDGDGRTDIVFADFWGSIWWLRRLPDLSWADVELLWEPPWEVPLWWRGSGDFDGDGRLDFLVHGAPWLADEANGELPGWILLDPFGNPAPWTPQPDFRIRADWAPRVWEGFFQEFPSLAADLDGDGCADLATTAYQGGDQSVRLARGDCGGGLSSFTEVLVAPPAQRGLELFDVDGDGQLDVWTSSDDDGDPGQTHWFAGDGDGGFGSAQEFIDFRPGSEQGADDFRAPGMCRPSYLDGDLRLDLVCTWGGYRGAEASSDLRFGDPTGAYDLGETPMLNPQGWFPPGVVGPLPF
jgi:hypothetical protein